MVVCSPFKKINQFLPLDVLGAFRVLEKEFNLIFSIFFLPKNVNTPVT